MTMIANLNLRGGSKLSHVFKCIIFYENNILSLVACLDKHTKEYFLNTSTFIFSDKIASKTFAAESSNSFLVTV